MLADAFLIITSLLLVIVTLTQIVAPLIQNKPLFGSFRKSYQRERWLREQLEETQRRLKELELEKQLTERQNELIRRQMEQMESCGDFGSVAADQRQGEADRRKGISEKER
jgi:hypothetical protein